MLMLAVCVVLLGVAGIIVISHLRFQHKRLRSVEVEVELIKDSLRYLKNNLRAQDVKPRVCVLEKQYASLEVRYRKSTGR